MNESDRMDLEARVARLERMVEGLYAAQRQASPRQRRPTDTPGGVGEADSAPLPDPAPKRPVISSPESPRHEDSGPSEGEALRPDWTHLATLAGKSEQWLGRVGVGFVILALAFLLKLSFDRGWITPSLRLAAGFGTGGVLLFLGLRLGPTRRTLEQALLGGAVAIFYLTGFAGFQLYGLLPFWLALSLMSTTTVLSIALSERQDSALLAVIGVSGGLATPFLLDSGSGDVNALVIYASLVLLGGGAVHFQRGWGVLLATMLVGGSGVMTAAAMASGEGTEALSCLGILIFWLVVTAAPVLRPWMRPGSAVEGVRAHELWPSRLATGIGTGVSVVLMGMVLDLGEAEVGYLLLGFGAVLAALAYLARRERFSLWPAAEVSALCMAGGLWLWVGDSPGLLLILVEAAALAALARQGGPASLSVIGHGIAGVVAVGFLSFAETAPVGEGLLGFREGVYSRMGILAILALMPLWTEERAKPWYLSAAFIGLLVLFWSELNPLPFGPQLVTIAWSVQGAVVLVASVRRESQILQLAGLGTLGLVAGKLLLVDLSQLDPAWRILMFFCFGVALLGLAYLVNRPRDRGGASTSL